MPTPCSNRPAYRGAIPLALAALALLLALPALADNKSGVEPQVLSLPKGPGAIEGLGESFEPQHNTGTAAYRVPLAVPPGVAGFQPELTLVYDGGYGNGALGLGWRLDLPMIARQTDKGLPAYTDADTLLHSSAGELAPVAVGLWRARIEGAFLRVQRDGAGFLVTQPNGVRQWFGTAAEARVETARGSFEWRLERAEDNNGNRILYQYQRDGGQLYLSGIQYCEGPGGAVKTLSLTWEARPDPVLDYRSRARIATARRLTGIEARAAGRLVRAWRLSYADGTPSLLRQVVQVGADGTSTLPPMTFSYSRFDRALVETIALANPPPRGVTLDSGNLDLVDIDGDGLPDLFQTPGGGNPHRFYVNRGRGGFAPEPVLPAHSPRGTLATDGVLLADMNGDGRADLFLKTSDRFGWFHNRGALTWEDSDWTDGGPAPRFGFEDSRTRMLDLNNDKLIDVLRDQGDRYLVWLNPGAGTWSADFDHESVGTWLPLDRTSVRLGDMNGDRIDDLIWVLDGWCSYFPGMGLGEFDAEVVMDEPPWDLDATRLTLTDFDHDGLGDWVEVGNRFLRVWRNAGNGSFEPEWLIEDTPASNGRGDFRFADMDGDGSRDLVVSNDSTGAEPWQLVRFNQGTHPNLLTGIDNGLGQRTEIAYRSSIEDYLRDRDAGTPWTHKLPFPVPVVARVSVRDANSGQTYVTDYRYRDGWYDGTEKEFRGFGGVERLEQGGAGAPGLLTRWRFDLGDGEESRKGLMLSETSLAEGGSLTSPAGVFEHAEHGLVTRVLATASTGQAVRWSYTARTDRRLYEGTATPVTLRRDWQRDDYGNVTLDADYGIVAGNDLARGDDDLLTATDYALDLPRWRLDRPRLVHKTRLDGRFVALQRLTYDDRGNLTLDERSPDGVSYIPVTAKTWDARGNVTRITDANGHWRALDYDATFGAFPVRETIGGLGLTMGADYDLGLGLMTGFTDPNGQTTGFGYDTFGRLARIVKPGDSDALPTQAFEYRLGAPVSAIVTRQRTASGTAGTYDSLTWFDGLGRKLQTRSAGPHGDWVVSDAVTFNARRGIARQWLPHFAAGPDYAAPDPALAHSDLAYDARGRPIRETNPDGSVRTIAYGPLSKTEADEEDNRTGSPHAGTPRISITDGRERLIEVRERNGAATWITRYGYDGLDNLIRIQDAQGNLKTLRFDGLGRKTAMNDPDKGVMTWGYDDAGNLLLSTDAKGQTLTYRYDPANRTLSEDGTGVRVRWHYDAARPADAPALAPLMTRTQGRLAWVEDQAGRDFMGYDARGRVIAQVREQDGLRFVTRLTHDAADRLTRQTWPDGSAVDYRYNGMNRLASIPGYVDAIDYAANGQKTALTLANGVTSGYDYDQRQRLSRLRTTGPGGPVLQDLAYSYDGTSNIRRIADQRPVRTPEDRTGDYGYDDLYRLTSATAPAWAETYAYDSIGNMTFKSDLGAMGYGAGSAGPHALTRTGSGATAVDYRYDGNGNLAGKPGFSYQFDARDRLSRVDRAAVVGRPAAVIDYAYDSGFDRRRKTVRVGGATETTLYIDRHTELRGDRLVKQVFAGDRLIARVSVAPFHPSMLAGPAPLPEVGDLDVAPADGVISLAEITALGADPQRVEPTDAAAALAIYHAGRIDQPGRLPFATMAAAVSALGTLPAPPVTETVFYLPDHLGSASVVADAAGGVLEEAVFYPYGADRARAGAYRSEYRFTGKELDGEAGLTYFGARYYDASVGGFVSVDPLHSNDHSPENARKLTAYSYVNNRPLILIDPNGLASIGTQDWNNEFVAARANDLARFEQMKKDYAIWQSHGGAEAAAQVAYNEEYIRGLDKTINFVKGVKWTADIFVHFGSALAGAPQIASVYDGVDKSIEIGAFAGTCAQTGCSSEQVGNKAASLAFDVAVNKVGGALLDKAFPVTVFNQKVALSQVSEANFGIANNLGRSNVEAAITGSSILVKEFFFGN